MQLWMALILIALAIAVGVAIARSRGSRRWSTATTQWVDTLARRSTSQRPATSINFQELPGLPDPVVRYLRYALQAGQQPIRTACIIQTGELRAVGKKEGGWKPFVVVQTLAAQRPGFVWDASIGMAPWLPVRVRDAYVAGYVSGQVSVLSLVTLAEERGKRELDAGALHRYLAESVWVSLKRRLMSTTKLVFSL